MRFDMKELPGFSMINIRFDVCLVGRTPSSESLHTCPGHRRYSGLKSIPKVAGGDNHQDYILVRPSNNAHKAITARRALRKFAGR